MEGYSVCELIKVLYSTVYALACVHCITSYGCQMQLSNVITILIKYLPSARTLAIANSEANNTKLTSLR